MKKNIVILGGGLTGCTAALRAKEAGMEPVIVERRSYLGFEVNGRYQIFTEKEAWEAYQNLTILKWNGKEIDNEICFYQGETKSGLMKQIYEEKIPCLLFTETAGLVFDHRKRIGGLILANSYGAWYLKADAVLDCTGDGAAYNKVCGLKTSRGVQRASYVFEIQGEELKNGELCLEGDSVWNGKVKFHSSKRGADTKLVEFETEVQPEEIAAAEVRSRIENCVKAEAALVLSALREHFAGREIELLSVATEVSTEPVCGDLTEEISGLYENQKPLRFAFTPGDLIQMEQSLQKIVSAVKEETEISLEADTLFVNGREWPLNQVVQMRKGQPVEIMGAVLYPVSLDKKTAEIYKSSVAVAGLGTAGMAALYGVKEGSGTVGIENQYILGGTRTAGHVANYFCGRIGGFTQKINDIYDDFDCNVIKTSEEYRKRVRFNHASLTLMHHYEAVKNNRKLFVGSVVFDTIKEGSAVKGVMVANEAGVFAVYADVTIDGTGNGDVAVLAGAEFQFGSKEEGISQTYSQWGVEERAHENFHHRRGAGDYDMVDTTEYKDMLRASMIGQMRNCNYYSSNPVSYREGRRIIGQEYLDVKRAIRNQGITEPMAVATSIIDNHGKTVVDFSRLGFATGIVKHKFVLPLGCFIPKGIDGLLVGGKAISVDRDTISVVRMVADIQNAGYALGYLAGRMAKNGGKAVEYGEIRDFLKKEDLIPDEYVKRHFPTAKEAVECLTEEDPFSLMTVVLQEKEEALPMLKEAWEKEKSEEKRILLAKSLAWFGDETGRDLIVKRLCWLKDHEEKTVQDLVIKRNDTIRHGIDEKLDDYWDMNQLIEVAGRIKDKEITKLLCEIIDKSETGGAPYVSSFPYFGVRRDTICVPYFDRILNLVHVFAEFPDLAAGKSLADLLKKDYIGGGYNAAAVTDEPLPLSSYLEIMTAIAAYRCGREEGRLVLERYAQDIRSIYAKLAVSCLTDGNPAATGGDRQRMEILERLEKIPGEISGIRLYLKQIYAIKHFSYGVWSSRQHVIIAISAEGKTGFAESVFSVNDLNPSLESWKEQLAVLEKKQVGSAIKEVRDHQGIWQDKLTEMTEMALIDLGGKIAGVSANTLLGLNHSQPVCGVYVILSDNLEEVAECTQWAKEQKKSDFIKVKLFGNSQLDCDVIRTVRKYCDCSKTYLIGDVNCGYRPKGQNVPLTDIAEAMVKLHEAGLDACEDPAFLDQEEWVRLQAEVKPLAIIPDYPMRPARQAIDQICEGMGEIYNIHPDCSGSIVDAIVLAGRVKRLGAKLMIGDDSLVGPSATIWQQLAYGLNAQWVEAAEKRDESDFYYRCVKSMATDSSKNPIQITLKDGFGIELDENRLKTETDLYIEVFHTGESARTVC